MTGVELGLTLAYDREQAALLVPAWLFTTAHGSDRAGQIPRIALAPEYIDEPGPGGGRPVHPTMSASSVPGGSGSGPASPAPGGDPGTGKGGGAAGTSPPPWPADGRPMTGPWAETAAGGRALTLHFFGGPREPESCRVTYSADVTESGDRVLVEITSARPQPRRTGSDAVECPAVSVERAVDVRLERPLGDRTVLRLPQGEEIPVRGR